MEEERKVINQNICCIYPECTSTSLNTKVINTPDIKLQEVICYELKREIEDIFLCEKHYQFFYRKLNAYHPCASCGAKPKVRQGPYFRHSPDPTIINDYLKDQTEKNVAIAETDTICKSCYDMHATIIADIKTASTRTVPSLESSIQSWSLRTKQDNADHLSTSIISTVIFTAKS